MRNTYSRMRIRPLSTLSGPNPLSPIGAFKPNSRPQRRFNARVLGFTLLELLVVVVIIGLLVSYVGPRYFSQVGKSEVGTAKAQIDALEKALDQYRLDTGRYPRE